MLSTGNDSRVPLVAAEEVLEAGINWGVTVGYELEVVAAELEEKGQATAVMFVVVPVLGLEVEFWHLLWRPGRQLSQILPSFAQEQFLQLPVLLQRQHVIFHRSLGLQQVWWSEAWDKNTLLETEHTRVRVLSGERRGAAYSLARRVAAAVTVEVDLFSRSSSTATISRDTARIHAARATGTQE